MTVLAAMMLPPPRLLALRRSLPRRFLPLHVQLGESAQRQGVAVLWVVPPTTPILYVLSAVRVFVLLTTVARNVQSGNPGWLSVLSNTSVLCSGSETIRPNGRSHSLLLALQGFLRSRGSPALLIAPFKDPVCS